MLAGLFNDEKKVSFSIWRVTKNEETSKNINSFMDLDDEEFIRFTTKGNANGLEYMIIGGLALILNGAIRYTKDADVWIEPTNRNKEIFLKTLLDIGYEPSEITDIAVQDFTQPQIIRIAGPIDIMTVVHRHVHYAECRQRAGYFTTSTQEKIPFIHINDLREIKVLARRTQDLFDVLMIDEILAKKKKTDTNPSE